jgi:hypothetical protein
MIIDYEQHCRAMHSIGIKPAPEDEWEYGAILFGEVP